MITTPKTVLVIDDEPDIRESLELALELEGCRVRSAEDRDAGLAELNTGFHPDVILMDYWMTGMSAQTFIDRVSSIKEHPPLIVLMTAATPADKARQLGLKHFLKKPFDYDQLLTLVDASVMA